MQRTSKDIYHPVITIIETLKETAKLLRLFSEVVATGVYHEADTLTPI